MRSFQKLVDLLARCEAAAKALGPRGAFARPNEPRAEFEQVHWQVLANLRDRFGHPDDWLRRGRPVRQYHPNTDRLAERLSPSALAGAAIVDTLMAPNGTGKGIIIITTSPNGDNFYSMAKNRPPTPTPH